MESSEPEPYTSNFPRIQTGLLLYVFLEECMRNLFNAISWHEPRKESIFDTRAPDTLEAASKMVCDTG